MSSEQQSLVSMDYAESDQLSFYGALRHSAVQFGCEYLSYVCEYPTLGLRFGFTSNPDWQKEYITKHLIDDCHLWKTVHRYFVQTQRQSFILPWETVRANTSCEKDIILYRDEMSVGRNGITFALQDGYKKEYMAFAPGGTDKQFVQRITSNIDSVRDIAAVFRDASGEAILQATNTKDGHHESKVKRHQ